MKKKLLQKRTNRSFLSDKKINEIVNKIVRTFRDNWHFMQNASPSEEDDGSMIKYWEETTGIDLHDKLWECPKCGEKFERQDLDGSHVVFFFGGNTPQYITPLCQHCNRERDDRPFLVRKEYMIPTP